MKPRDILRLPWLGRLVSMIRHFCSCRRHAERFVVVSAIDRGYMRPYGTMLVSLMSNNPGPVEAVIISADLTPETIAPLQALTVRFPGLSVRLIQMDGCAVSAMRLNTSIAYISKETFFRFLIPDLLQEYDKVLYLDADMLVCGSLRALWATNLNDAYAAGVPDAYIRSIGYDRELGLRGDECYVNAGVLLMNLKALRDDHVCEKLKRICTEQILRYMDQDAINLVFRGRIIRLPDRYNVNSVMKRSGRHAWRQPTILHFSNPWKPWRCDFQPGSWWYLAYQADWEYYSGMPPVIRIGLIAEKDGGEYSPLVRDGICAWIPNGDIQADILLNTPEGGRHAVPTMVGRTYAYTLPSARRRRVRWLRHQNYAMYLCMDLTNDSVLSADRKKDRRVLFWVQNPRTEEDWRTIASVRRCPVPSQWNPALSTEIHALAMQGRIRFMSQATCLNEKIRQLYGLSKDTPIEVMPIPVAMPYSLQTVMAHPKRDLVVFLGQSSGITRPWIFCEIARAMPDLEFCLVNAWPIDATDPITEVLEPYRVLSNLWIVDTLKDEARSRLLLDAKLLVVTSIDDGLSNTFPEAMACGVLPVSNQNPERLAERFGCWIDTAPGDGDVAVPHYVSAIRSLISDEQRRRGLMKDAMEYVQTVHAPSRFVERLRALIREETIRCHLNKF